MNRYYFTARSPTGEIFKGYHECSNETELKTYINNTSYKLLRFRITKKVFKIDISNNISLKDLLLLLEKWLMMIRSGLSFTQAVKVSVDSFHNKKLCIILKKMYQELRKGKSLGDFLSSCKNYFPSYFVMMMKVSEQSGNMPEVLKELIKYYRFEDHFKKDIKSALFYPMILSIFSLIIILVLVFYILPTFEEIFTEMNAKLPSFTLVILRLSEIIREYFLLFILFCLCLIFIIYSVYKTKWGKYIKDFKRIKLSPFKNIYQSMMTSKFSIAYRILYDSGINSIQALEMVSKSLDNSYLLKQMKFVGIEVQKGIKLSLALKSINFFPQIFIDTLSIGEDYAALSDTLSTLGIIYEEQSQTLLKRLSTIIEPIFIIIISLVVVGIIASIYIPLFSLLDGIVNL